MPYDHKLAKNMKRKKTKGCTQVLAIVALSVKTDFFSF